MMKCVRCHREIPADVVNPNFCVYCGRPISQACPYDGSIIKLYNERGISQAYRCPVCFGMLTACSSCGRLHRLDEMECNTPECNHKPLKEVTKAFPTSSGSLSGTCTAEFFGGIGFKISDKFFEQEIDELQSLTYRYGMLIAISSRCLYAYWWKNNVWVEEKSILLTDVGDIHVESTIIDEGLIYILCRDRALIVDVSNFSIRSEINGNFIRHAKEKELYCRLRCNDENTDTEIQVINNKKNIENSYQLPLNANNISDIIISNKILISAISGEIYSVDPDNGNYESISAKQYRWCQMSTDGSRIMALGRNDENKLIMLEYTLKNHQVIYSAIDGDYIESFAWVQPKGKIFFASENKLASLSDTQLTINPDIIDLPPAQPHGKMLALYSDNDKVRLLLKRFSSGHHNLLMIDPETSAQISIGSNMHSSPIVCFADDHIVIAVNEDDGMKLRTFSFMGEL